jgi:hypothetical protein
VEDLVGGARNDVLFRQHLDSIRERLQQAEGPGAIWPRPILYAAEHLSFNQREHREQAGENNDDRRDAEQAVRQPAQRLGEEACEPIARNERETFQGGVGSWRDATHFSVPYGDTTPNRAVMGAATTSGEPTKAAEARRHSVVAAPIIVAVPIKARKENESLAMHLFTTRPEIALMQRAAGAWEPPRSARRAVSER